VHKHVPEFIDHLRQRKMPRPLRASTIKVYGTVLLRWRDVYPGDINTATEDEIEGFLNRIRGNGSWRYVAAVALKNYYRWLGRPLGDRFKISLPAAREYPAVTDVEFELIKRHASPRIRNLINFLALTGVRISEALGAQAGDFELDRIEDGRRRPAMKVRGKGGKIRRIPLVHRGLVEWLRRQVAGPFEGMSYDQAWGGIHAAAERAGVQRLISEPGEYPPRYYVSPHAFRRYAATRLLDRGVDIDVVQTVLRHSNINTTLRYAKTRENRVWAQMGQGEAYVQ
jgi:integrase